MDNQTENLVIHREKVTFANGEKDITLFVRGLGFPQIIRLVRTHRATLESLYEEAITGALTLDDPEQIVTNLLDHFEALAMDIIALALGDPADPDFARRLPAGVQLAILDKTILLTLAVEGGLGKVMEIVARAMRATSDLMSQEA